MQSSGNTSKTKSGSERTPSFVCELPLRVTSAKARILNSRLEAARQIYNACLDEALGRARLLRERQAYQAARRLSKGKERTTAFKEVRQSVGFTDGALREAYGKVRELCGCYGLAYPAASFARYEALLRDEEGR